MTHVAVAGATGLVGAACLDLLAEAPGITGVTALVRRAPLTPHPSPRLRIETIDFDRLEAHRSLLAVDAIVCALGTTMRVAGSREAFRRVDFAYPLALARLGRAEGVAHFLLVSALGADPASRVFYNRTKGELEVALRALAFPSLTIVRPSFLLGDRTESRPGEVVGRWISRVAPARWRGVSAGRVAAALVRSIVHPPSGQRVVENAELLHSDT